ncbi:glycosyltransferase [Vagococcus sp. DIV0080]|uniref:Glycosyltransferase n=1 Tax=Candidatus Vagococcus giribetii TaxID=2230876 RepID=A0ABS3HU74_9ENTE|nr:glycosyltransferase [Vagococcus sp. DIV0080]MBO0477308.1 glycosyltransferase [Vagococcus sp. DIV0080]
MKYEKYSVLLSIYHKEKAVYLTECFKSILTQTVQPDQIVIVKDGPITEELEFVVNDFIKKNKKINITIVENKTNLGLGKALNKGLNYCVNNLVARVDTDDINKENRMELQLKEFLSNKNLSVCGSNIEEFDDNIMNIESIRKVPETHQEIFRESKSRNPMNHMTVMFKKSDVIASGSYEDFPYFEDYFLWVRMLVNKFEFFNIQESLVYARVESNFFERRGGIQYFIKELNFQKKLKEMKYISTINFIKNILLRCLPRLLPKKMLKYVYLNYSRLKPRVI